ncbi:hypothetical protein Tco_1038999 [Tanacetum coccineum]
MSDDKMMIALLQRRLREFEANEERLSRFLVRKEQVEKETCLISKKNIIEAKVKDQVVEDLDAKKKETLQEVILEGVGEGIAFMSTIYIDDDEIPKLMAGENFEAAAKGGQKS